MTLRDRLLQAAFADLSPLVKRWSAEAAVRASLETWLDGQLARCDDPAFAARFQAACPVEGVPAEDYLQRVLPLSTGDQMLAGIRFRGGNLDFPFVDLVAATDSLHPGEVLVESVQALRQAFANFAPRAVRILRSASAPPLEQMPWRVELDQTVIAGPVGVISRSVRDCRWVPCRSGRGGAAVQYSLDGYEVIEEVLAAEWRGRGLAAAAQRRMVDHIAASVPETVLYGTIAALNQASLATAHRVGRLQVASYLFIS